ncbi:uncharacterized protein LOC132637728 [Lycium barbarum]|uniref:uncharacterized protein LOC132637728 n=1 Tax=Lycium barbarum TaxID=112863 RepID=UPI00293E29B7|nr:uncharacterized protein LOC132637728 [Lycium barbarum]
MIICLNIVPTINYRGLIYIIAGFIIRSTSLTRKNPKNEEQKPEEVFVPAKTQQKQVNEEVKQSVTKPVATKGKGSQFNGNNNRNNSRMEWNVVTNKKKRKNSVEELQGIPNHNNADHVQKEKGKVHEENNDNSFEVLATVEEEQSIEIVHEKKKKKPETTKTWIESTFSKTKKSTEEGNSQKQGDCGSTNKDDSKEDVEEGNNTNN